MGLTLCVLGLLGPGSYVLDEVNYSASCGNLIRYAAEVGEAQVAQGYLDGAVYFMERHNMFGADEDGIGQYAAAIRGCRDALRSGARLEDVQAELRQHRKPLTIAQYPLTTQSIVGLVFGVFFFILGIGILNCKDIDREAVI